jgi:hypothetical protein
MDSEAFLWDNGLDGSKGNPSLPLVSLRKCFEIGLSLAWIATPVLTDGVRKSKPASSKTASKLAGFGNPAKQQGISKTLSRS